MVFLRRTIKRKAFNLLNQSPGSSLEDLQKNGLDDIETVLIKKNYFQCYIEQQHCLVDRARQHQHRVEERDQLDDLEHL